MKKQNFTNIGNPKDKKKKSFICSNYLSINVFNTEYQVIIDSAKELGFRPKMVDPGLSPIPSLLEQAKKEADFMSINVS